MEFNLKEGLVFTQEIEVTEKDTAKSHGSGKLDVFATPAMIALMENTAVKCIDADLKEGFDTVGIEINAKHIKATKVGGKVSCTAKLVTVDGKKLAFEIEAKDQDGPIGTASHKRYIIEPEKFMSRI
jgi:predicted thioesterase